MSKYLEINYMQIYFARLLITLNVPLRIDKCTPPDRQMYPWGYMYPRLGTPDLLQTTVHSIWKLIQRNKS